MKYKAAMRLLGFLDEALSIFSITCILLLFAYGCFVKWDTDTLQKEASPGQYSEYKPAGADARSFGELQSINSDVIGWLSIYGTRIDYPLLHSDDNEKYLTADAEGEYSVSGSIFLDYRNNADFEDFNSIIYGHHMAHREMFGDIENFGKKEYFNSHMYGTIYFDGEEHGLELFAYCTVDAYQTQLYDPAENEESRSRYIENLKDSALNYRDISIVTGDHIVLLSTCSSGPGNGRSILAGRVSDRVTANTAQGTDSAAGKSDRIFFAVCLSAGLIIVLLATGRYIKAKRSRRP